MVCTVPLKLGSFGRGMPPGGEQVWQLPFPPARWCWLWVGKPPYVIPLKPQSLGGGCWWGLRCGFHSRSQHHLAGRKASPHAISANSSLLQAFWLLFPGWKTKCRRDARVLLPLLQVHSTLAQPGGQFPGCCCCRHHHHLCTYSTDKNGIKLATPFSTKMPYCEKKICLQAWETGL